MFSVHPKGFLSILVFFCIEQAICSLAYWNSIRDNSHIRLGPCLCLAEVLSASSFTCYELCLFVMLGKWY